MSNVLAKTPWVDRSLKTVWERVVAASPRPEWAPRLMPGRKFSLEEYGCGHYGCVFPTSDPAVVAKLTSDPTEAFFVAAALSIGTWPEGIVRYHAIYRIPGAEYRGRPLFVLWREEATEVGKVTRRTYWGSYQDLPANEQYEFLARAQLQRNLERFKEAAAIVRDTLKRANERASSRIVWEGEPPAAPFTMVEEAKKLAEEWAWRYVADAYAAARPVAVGSFRGAQKVAVLLVMLERIAQEMENEYLSDQIGTAFAFYLENDLLLADVHAGNIGLVEGRVGKSPVITDPGHAVPLSSRWQTVQVPELP